MKKYVRAFLLSVCLIALGSSFVSCAPSGQPAESKPESQQSISVDWSIDGDCTTCHVKAADSMKDSACLVSTHAAQGLDCVDCHKDSSELEKAHENATVDGAAKLKRLKATKIDEATCLSCHSKTELAAATANSTVLTDKQGKVVNPHALPDNADHASTTCSSCHLMHVAEPVEESAPDYCLSCHHEDVYECHTCHD